MRTFKFVVLAETEEEAIAKIKDNPGDYLDSPSCEIMLSDGNIIHPDEEGTIRRKDAHGNTIEVRTVDDDNYLEWLELFVGSGWEFFVGQRVHIDVDDMEWGRVASDATVLEVHIDDQFIREEYLLLSVDSIRANISVELGDAHPIMELGKHFDPDFEDYCR